MTDRSMGFRGRDLAPDTIVHSGQIVTMADNQPRAEALAIKDGRIVAAGPNQPVRALAGPATRLLDLGGKTVVPGLNDSHIHVLSTGAVLAQVQLYDCRSIQAIQDQVAAAVKRAAPGQWIVGRGWNETLLTDQRFPNRWDLDAVAPENPVLLERVWNMLVCNSRALARAGVSRATPDPDPNVAYSGRIDRDAVGEPTGVFRDRAKALIQNAVPPKTVAEREAQLRLACQALNRVGITSATDPGVLADWITAYQNVKRDGGLTVRMSLCPAGWGATMDPQPRDLRAWIADLGAYTGFGDARLKYDAIKFMPDGGIGDRTALVYEPYLNEPTNFGQAIVPEAELRDHVRWCHDRGWSIDMHTCGDRCQDIVVRAYADAYLAAPNATIRHRVHHGYFPTPASLELMRRHQIGALTTIPFLYTMGENFVQSVGPARAAKCMPLRTYLEAGVPTTCSSDSTVATFNPFVGIYTATTRRTQFGLELGPAERISREAAIRAYTVTPAWTTFEEGVKGSLAPGRLADLVVLDRDILTVTDDDLLKLEPVLTMLGGEIVYEASAANG